MIKIDLKDAYFTVPIDPEHQPLLRFILAPLLFTKLLKPVVAFLRRLGLRMIIYLFRRYNYIQSDSGRYFEGQGLHSVAASELRLCNKLEEIGFTPSPVHGVPRFSDQFRGDETIFARGKNGPTYSDFQRFNS